MKFAILKNGVDRVRDQIAEELIEELVTHGCSIGTMNDKIKFVLNFTTIEHPFQVLRHGKNEFVVSVISLTSQSTDLQYSCYNALIKTFSNLLVCIQSIGERSPEIYCITPEMGFYHFPYTPQDLRKNIWPIIGSHFIIDNKITPNLPEKYWKTPITEQLKYYGGVLKSMGVLPSPFNLESVLNHENLEHLYRLFNIRGLSYGNLSSRESIPEFGPNTFWMTARGVDKSHLQGVGQDILLVTGYDLEEEKILVSLPPDYRPSIRVSVDAIEHALIYESYPSVGAIVHMHAWYKDSIPATRQNYPCGTIELAREAVAKFSSISHPETAVIGQKNHGLTITGECLEEIFERIEGKLIKEVPMMV